MNQNLKCLKILSVEPKNYELLKLASSKKQGEYQFTNQLYPMYFLIQTIKEDEIKP